MKKLVFIGGAFVGFYAGMLITAVAIVTGQANREAEAERARRAAEPKPGDPYPYPAKLDSNISDFCGRRPSRGYAS